MAKLEELKQNSENLKNDYELIIQQLRILKDNHHSLQLHIHPQWYFSQYDYEKEKWIIDTKHYSLDNCTIEECDKIIRMGINMLHKIKHENNSDIIYRAGGYSFPSNKVVADFFLKNGISKDSSVLPNEKSHFKFLQYDYRGIKTSKIYNFNTTPKIPNKEGKWIEYPIFTFKIPRIIKYCINKHIDKSKLKIFGDGKGVNCFTPAKPIKAYVRILNKFKILKKDLIRASMDLSLPSFMRYWMKFSEKQKVNDLVIIGHPKNQCLYSLEKMDEFVSSYKNYLKVF